MEQEKIIDFMDKLEEAEIALESMHHISVLLMDAYKESRDEGTARLIYCFYTYSVFLQGIIQPCIDKLDRYLLELKKRERTGTIVNEVTEIIAEVGVDSDLVTE